MFSCTKNCKMEKRPVTFSLQRVISRITRNLKYRGKIDLPLHAKKGIFNFSSLFDCLYFIIFCIEVIYDPFLTLSRPVHAKQDITNFCIVREIWSLGIIIIIIIIIIIMIITYIAHHPFLF